MWHPTLLLAGWMGFALTLQWQSSAGVMVAALCCILASGVFARARTLRLLLRARWLLLSLVILFIFFTPGEYLPGTLGDVGISYEGLWLALGHCGRLIALLASLALLHECIETSGLLAGLYCLLVGGPWRERTVVRLMLVLEYVEQACGERHWRDWLSDEVIGAEGGAEYCHLRVTALDWRDRSILIAAVVAGLVFAGMA
jgi:hypothetical protein